MDGVTAVLTRRSIRKYTGKPASDEQLHTILRAGFSAPTCAGFRPWQFVVIKDQESLNAIVAAHPHSKPLLQAGCCIAVCGDKRIHDNEYYLNQDCSAAIENMLLTAHGLGLGGLWMGVYPFEDKAKPMRMLMELPEEVLLFGLVAVGEAAEEKDAPDRYNSERAHFEKW